MPRQCERQRTRTSADVDDDGFDRKSLRDRPFQDRLGFRARDENPGTDGQRQWPERGGAGEVLQGHAAGSRGDRGVVVVEEQVVGRAEQ